MNKRLFGWILFIGLAVMLFMLLNKSNSLYPAITMDEFESRLKNDRVRTVIVETDRVLGEFNGDETIGDRGERLARFRVELPQGTTQDWEFMRWLLDNRRSASVRIENNPNWLLQVVIPLIPWLLIFGFIWFFVFRNLRKVQAIDPNAPRPVYFVPPPQGQAQPVPPLAAMHSPPPSSSSPPSTPAPGGDN